MDTLRVVVQTGTGYDLLLSAVLIADRTAERRLSTARAIRERAQAIGGGAVSKTIEAVGREPFINLLGFAQAKTDDPTAANTVAAIEAADARELHLALVGHYRRAMRINTPPAIMRAAVDGDAGAIREFRRTSYPGLGHWQGSLRYLLGRSSREIHDELAAALRAWLESGFSHDEARIAAVQRADAVKVSDLVATLDLDSVLERVMPGITFARELGQDMVVLVPSVIVRPAFALADYGSTMVIAYPAAGDVDEAAKPPERLIALGKALGDELRLRALRELRHGPLSASELARRLGVPRTTIHHHVSLLLHAGLVRMSVDDARTGNIELRADGVTDLAEMAQAWLMD